MWFRLKLQTSTRPEINLMDIKVTIDPNCKEPGVYNITFAHAIVEIFQMMVAVITGYVK